MENILSFIKRRWAGTDAKWLTGNCYWFAYILSSRFKKLKIYYLPIQGHFVCGDPNTNVFFDITGQVTPDEQPVALETIKTTDKKWYNRLMRDCRN